MGKRIYVNGGIFVNTRYFIFSAGAECLSAEQPEGSFFLEPKDEVDGSKCLVIDDNHPQSIFNTYYAKTFITSCYQGAEFLIRNYRDCFTIIDEDIEEVKTIISSISPLEQGIKDSLMKLLYINLVTILDSFICSIILSTIVKDETKFIAYYNKSFSNEDKVKLDNYLINDNRGKWELEIFDKILHTSYGNIDKIKDSFGSIGLKKPKDENGVMKEHFHNRNILVHRNGKMKDGNRIRITEENVKQLIDDTSRFIERIRESLPQE